MALKTQAGPPEPPVHKPVGGAASADPQAPARRLLAALNKIRGERLGPSEHMALPTTERAEEAPEAPIDPKRAQRTGQRLAESPPRREANSGFPNWEFSVTLLSLVIIPSNRIK